MEILWIAIHTGITGNKLADHGGKAAPEVDSEKFQPVSFTEIKKRWK